MKTNRLSPGILALLVVTFAVAGGVAGLMLFRASQQPAADLPAIVIEGDETDGVTPIEPPEDIAPFTLINTAGETVSLEDYAGRHVLLYFGYTYCPDFCPATLTDFRLVKRDLGDLAEGVEFVMISVDNERDTPESLSRYMTRFDPSFIGLTGSDDQISAAADAFNVYYEVEQHEEGMPYMVGHTASKFLIDDQGQLVAIYAFGTQVDSIVTDLRARLSAS